MYRTVDDVCHLVHQQAESGDLSAALNTIADFVRDVIAYDAALANVFSSPVLDRTCLGLGQSLDPSEPEERDPERAVFIVTALFKAGGHSRTLLDLAAADPASAITVLITNVHHDYSSEQIDSTLSYIQAGPRVAVEIAPLGTAEERLRWLQRKLRTLRPARTYLLQHPQDSVCIAAAQSELVGKLFYVHHCDHALALGVHIPHSVHVDIGAKSFHNCLKNEGVRNNVVWPLAADISKHRVDKPFLTNGRLRTATSGTMNKFGGYFKNPIRYSIDYARAIPLILQETGGTHVHIGALADPMLKDIAERLAGAKIDQNQFIYFPLVANVANTLLELDVDAYVGSFPSGGGRAIVEAMGAGLPLIVHSNYRSVFLSSENESYEGAMIWCTVSALTKHLRNLTEGELRRHAALARLQYEKHHTPSVLRARMLETFAGQLQYAPPPVFHHHDRLQAFLDSQWALSEWMQATRDETERQRSEIDRLTSQVAQIKCMFERESAENDGLRNELHDTERQRSEIDRLTSQVAQIKRMFERESAENDGLRNELHDTLTALVEMKHELGALRRGKFWRLAALLRRA